MKKIVFFLLFCFIYPICYGADINWSLPGTASGSGGTAGAPANIKDDNEATVYSDGCGVGSGWCVWDYTCEVEFAESADVINKAEIHHIKFASYGPGGGAGGNWYVDLYYGAAWNNVMNGVWGIGSATVTENDSTGWVDVTKIRLRADGSANAGALELPATSGQGTYELRAWGPVNPVGDYSYIY